MVKKIVGIMLLFFTIGANASLVSVGLMESAVPVSQTDTAWGGGATFLAGSDAVNKDGGSFDNYQAAYLTFSLTDAIAAIVGDSNGSDYSIDSITLNLPETWYPHNASFYLGAGDFDVSLISGTDTDGLTYDDPDFTMESLGVFYHEWEDTDETWDTHLYMPTSSYALTITDSLLSALLNGSDITLYLSPESDSVGLAFFNQNWGGGPTLDIDYSVVPEPSTVLLLLAGSASVIRRKRSV